MASLPYPRSHKYPTHPPKGVQQSLLHQPSCPRHPMDADMVAWVWQGCHTLPGGAAVSAAPTKLSTPSYGCRYGCLGMAGMPYPPKWCSGLCCTTNLSIPSYGCNGGCLGMAGMPYPPKGAAVSAAPTKLTLLLDNYEKEI